MSTNSHSFSSSNIKTQTWNWQLIYFLLHQTIKGKSTYRSLLHWQATQIEISGEVLDLGSGSTKPSYFRHLHTSKANFTFTDLHPKDKNTIKLDLQKPFKLKQTFNAIICFNLLEHLLHPNITIKQSYLHLKKNGTFHAWVPYLHPYHPDPVDHYRYSPETLHHLCSQAGFRHIEIHYIGLGPFLAAYSQLQYLLPPILRLFPLLLALILDLTLLRFSTAYTKRYALAYFLTAQK